MAVSTTTNRAQFTGDGATTDFAFTFPITVTSEILVYIGATQQTETTHYTVSATNNDFSSGGTVAFVTAPANLSTVTIERIVPSTSTLDLTPGTTLPAESVEDAIDRLTMQFQQLEDKLNRAITIPSTDPTTLDLELPEQSDRTQGSAMIFDANGQPAIGNSTDVTVSSKWTSIIEGSRAPYFYSAIAKADVTLTDTAAIARYWDPHSPYIVRGDLTWDGTGTSINFGHCLVVHGDLTIGANNTVRFGTWDGNSAGTAATALGVAVPANAFVGRGGSFSVTARGGAGGFGGVDGSDGSGDSGGGGAGGFSGAAGNGNGGTGATGTSGSGGAGGNASTNGANVASYGRDGGNGGAGGASGYGGGGGGGSYGGGGGAAGVSGSAGGTGGSVLFIYVAGNFTNNGTLSVENTADYWAVAADGGGGGGGGMISIFCAGTFINNGTIAAPGEDGAAATGANGGGGGGGGGGRITIMRPAAGYVAGTLTVTGGTGGAGAGTGSAGSNGQAGTSSASAWPTGDEAPEYSLFDYATNDLFAACITGGGFF